MFYNIKPESPGQKFGVFGFYAFLCSVLPSVQRETVSDQLESKTMSTKNTIRIVLNGGADEHCVDLGGGQYVSVYVEGGKLKSSVCGSGGGGCSGKEWVSLRLKLTSAERNCKQLDQELQAAKARISQLEHEKSVADDLLLSIGQSDYMRRLAEVHSTANVTARTELEAHCFAPSCRVWLIRRDLRRFVASMGSEWQKRDWCVVWQIFADLHWWTGSQKCFAEWVTEQGYDLTYNGFKCAKRDLKDLARWYAQDHGTDHFAVVARGLAALFVGRPTAPTSPAYEDSYMDHTALYRTIGLSQSATQGSRVYIHVDCPGHDESTHRNRHRKHSKYIKQKPHQSKECFIMAVTRHKTTGTFGRGQEMPAGMSRRLGTLLHTSRSRRGHSLCRGLPLR